MIARQKIAQNQLNFDGESSHVHELLCAYEGQYHVDVSRVLVEMALETFAY